MWITEFDGLFLRFRHRLRLSTALAPAKLAAFGPKTALNRHIGHFNMHHAYQGGRDFEITGKLEEEVEVWTPFTSS